MCNIDLPKGIESVLPGLAGHTFALCGTGDTYLEMNIAKAGFAEKRLPFAKSNLVALLQRGIFLHRSPGELWYCIRSSLTQAVGEFSFDAQSPQMKYVSGSSFKPEKLDNSEVFIRADRPILDLCRPTDTARFVILLSGEYNPEIWDLKLGRRFARLAPSPQALKRIAYDSRNRIIVAMDANGAIQSF
ncbi:MAG: hypothetical protein HQL31_05385 [Planctomycetes bacterium]|nr:hypothetical protein [Planctomycetota bacterium]